MKSRGMKVAIVGSRDCGSESERGIEMLDMIGMHEPSEIISGGARGIDSIAEKVGRRLGVKVTVFPADWQRYGKRAGFLRNQQIVDACDELWAWWDEKSKGTEHSIALAKSAGKPVTIFRITP